MVTYFKDRLYIAYYESSSTVKNRVIKSSAPLGIICLSNEDTTATSGSLTLSVTGDVKYAVPTETLEVWRGGTQIGSIVVNSKTQDQLNITITGTLTSAIQAADEFWVAGTKNGQKVFRWSDPNTGNDVERYDVFKIGGGDNTRINVMSEIGNVLWFATNNLFATWDGDYLKLFNYNIGCCAPNGATVFNALLYFIGDKGLYATDGATIPKNISAKINRYYKGIPKSIKENGVVSYSEESVFFSFTGTSTEKIILYNNDGSISRVLDNIVFEWNTRQENWYTHTSTYLDVDQLINAPINNMNDNILFTRHTDGKVYRFLNTTTRIETIDGISITARENSYVDVADDISFNITTSNIYLYLAETFCYPTYLMSEIIAGNNIKCLASFDDNPMYVQDVLVKGSNLIKFKPYNGETDLPRTRKVRISFRETSNRAVSIAKMAVLYKITDEQEPNEINN